MLYLCSENKGADQLRTYREADLRHCFRICKKPVFSRCGLYSGVYVINKFDINKDIKYRDEGSGMEDITSTKLVLQEKLV